ncbi:uncharacterized protein DSM5745_07850 [Aspergillus mulundensis]|uniref:Receptor L-domain domain-containing protein n=1 Tax=Aspergillus mulundensis TaxID=1810919 RepID=A0A3D8RFG1_9EURO|nr:hypothetical protein DSM5745_07850 [Aspergillus mulundensis]RDW72678.1 hypothetical protein DSM5745_07850 [Aspergillus mulundensis]
MPANIREPDMILRCRAVSGLAPDGDHAVRARIRRGYRYLTDPDAPAKRLLHAPEHIVLAIANIGYETSVAYGRHIALSVGPALQPRPDISDPHRGSGTGQITVKLSWREVRTYLAPSTPIALAKECETSTPDAETGEPILRVSSPEELSTIEGCTTLTGHIVINSDYSGDFILNGVTSISGNITTSAPADKFGVVELPDLVDVGNIWLVGLTNDVHLPKVERAGSINLVQASTSAEVDLGALTESDNVRAWGSWTRINLSSLETVTDELSICGSQNCGIYYDEEFPYLDVDLPSLKSANRFNIAGTIKTASVPSLEIVGTKDLDPWANRKSVMSQSLRINIQSGEFTLDFDAPNLRTINGLLEVYGGISRLSLGALGETNAGATFIARAPLEIYSTIKTAEYFYIWGELGSIDLPNFTDLGAVDLSYEPKIPCNETLYKLWEEMHISGGSESSFPTRCVRPADSPEDDEGNEGSESEENNNSLNDEDNTANADNDGDGVGDENSNLSTPGESTNNENAGNETNIPGSFGNTSNMTDSANETESAQTDTTEGNAAHLTHPLCSVAWTVLIMLSAILTL